MQTTKRTTRICPKCGSLMYENNHLNRLMCPVCKEVGPEIKAQTNYDKLKKCGTVSEMVKLIAGEKMFGNMSPSEIEHILNSQSAGLTQGDTNVIPNIVSDISKWQEQLGNDIVDRAVNNILESVLDIIYNHYAPEESC